MRKFDGKRSDTPIDIPEDQFLAYAISVIKKEWWLFPDYVWPVALLISGTSIFYYNHPLSNAAALLVSCYCAAQYFYRQGVYYGFRRGYEDGVEVASRALHRNRIDG